jgi:hypothetical protein
VNGTCELGLQYNVGWNTFMRKYDSDHYDWIFQCYYHYVWSDGSYSSPDQYYEWIGPHDGSGTGCTLGLVID